MIETYSGLEDDLTIRNDYHQGPQLNYIKLRRYNSLSYYYNSISIIIIYIRYIQLSIYLCKYFIEFISKSS